MGFPGGSVVKNLPDNAGNTGDLGSIPGSGRSLEEEMATHSSILDWWIPWTEEPGGLQSKGSKKVGWLKWLSNSSSTLATTQVWRWLFDTHLIYTNKTASCLVVPLWWGWAPAYVVSEIWSNLTCWEVDLLKRRGWAFLPQYQSVIREWRRDRNHILRWKFVALPDMLTE